MLLLATQGRYSANEDFRSTGGILGQGNHEPKLAEAITLKLQESESTFGGRLSTTNVPSVATATFAASRWARR